MAFYKFRPAIRLVNSSGGVISGPLKLWLPDSDTQHGILLSSSVPRYPAVENVYTNILFQERKIFYGFRPEVDLTFPALRADSFDGYALIASYFTASKIQGSYAALEFNAFHDSCNVWRGMHITSDWSPSLIGDKQRAGYEATVSLRARNLVQSFGDWSQGSW